MRLNLWRANIQDAMTKLTKPARKASQRAGQTLKGFRDFLPDEMRIRNFVLGVCKEVFESFGFEPLETPSLEYASTLLGKYGEEADRLVYTFKDRGGRDVGLIYDLTVPISRVLATYGNKIPLPFKRYQIQRVWRAEKPQKGRFREFVQCDFDIFGVASPLADAEIIAVIYQVLKRLGFEDFTIYINSRQVLSDLLRDLGIKTKERYLSALRTIDKRDKEGKEKVKRELREKGLDMVAEKMEVIEKAKPDANLKQTIDFAKRLGVNGRNLKFVPDMVRGLDYYTGPVFEVVVPNFPGSLAGGGRYNNLIKQMGGPNVPATGASIGLDRICELVKEKRLLREELKPAIQVLVTIFDESLADESLKLTTMLQSMDVFTEIYLDPSAKLDKQLKYADRKGIPYVIILGPDEIKSDKVTIKDLRTGEQEMVGRKDLVNFQFSNPNFQ